MRVHSTLDVAALERLSADPVTDLWDGRIYFNTTSKSVVTYDGTAWVVLADDAALTAHISDATAAHAASAISNTPAGNVAATTVQGAVDELQTDIDTRATDAALTAHVSDAVAAHAASAISNAPTGNVVSTTVQAAVNELQTDIDTRATDADLTSHTGATSAHGASGDLVGLNNAQTLTNKVIDANSNTLSNLAHGTQVDNLTVAHGATGAVVGTTNNQVLTNKTLTTPTLTTPIIDNAMELNHEVTPANPGASKIKLYPKSDDKLYSLNSAGVEVEIGSGGGTGSTGINYITNFDAEVNTSGWTASGANATITRNTTGPLRGLASFDIATLIGAALTDYIEYQFTLDEADANKILKLGFDFKGGTYNAGDFEVVIIKDPAGTPVEIVPSQTALADGQGKFEATFVSQGVDTYALRFKVATAATVFDVKIDNVSVGPETAFAAAPVTSLPDFTMTTNGAGTITDAKFVASRTGERISVTGRFRSGTVAASIFSLNLPVGYSIDYGKYSVDQRTRIGEGRDISTGASSNGTEFFLFLDGSNTSTIYIAYRSNTHSFLKENANAQISSNQYFSFNFELEISEWSGSGVDLSAARVEYAFNTNTADSSDTGSFGYGPNGTPFGNYTAPRTKTIEFQKPIQPSDVITYEYTEDSGATWITVGSIFDNLSLRRNMNGTGYGTALVPVSNTQMNVYFHGFRSSAGATGWGAAGTAWSSFSSLPNQYRWRVKKASPNAPAGIQLATSAVPGLLSLTDTSQLASGTNQGLISFYEEGSWTPAFGSPGAGTPVIQFGRYTKIGRLVHVVGKIKYSGMTSTAAIVITGLPFSSAESGDASQRSSARPEGDITGMLNQTNTSSIMFRVAGSTLQGVFVNTSGNTILALHTTHMGASAGFNFNVTYYAT